MTCCLPNRFLYIFAFSSESYKCAYCRFFFSYLLFVFGAIRLSLLFLKTTRLLEIDKQNDWLNSKYDPLKIKTQIAS